MSKVEASSIPAILDAIVGITSANGDTYLDNESMRNVEKLEAVCGWVCDRIHRAYSGDYPKQCASAEQVAHAVRRASGFILDYMETDRVERTCRMVSAFDTDELENIQENISFSPEDTLAYRCEGCGFDFRYERGIYPSYCPNCGARVVDA